MHGFMIKFGVRVFKWVEVKRVLLCINIAIDADLFFRPMNDGTKLKIVFGKCL